MAWILQCNPDLYNLEGLLYAGAQDVDWRCPQHTDKVEVGDHVWF